MRENVLRVCISFYLDNIVMVEMLEDYLKGRGFTFPTYCNLKKMNNLIVLSSLCQKKPSSKKTQDVRT